MKPLHKGIALAVIHVLLVCSLGAKLLMDRSHYPRVWVKTAAYDPNLPIRGRYASMRLIVEAPQARPMQTYNGIDSASIPQRAQLVVRDGKLAVIDDPWGSVSYQRIRPDQIVLHEPVAFFISEKAKDPTIRARDEELWVEVTVPRKGAPRPIRLAVKKDGALQPLELE